MHPAPGEIYVQIPPEPSLLTGPARDLTATTAFIYYLSLDRAQGSFS